jgi:hypothetical protein
MRNPWVVACFFLNTTVKTVERSSGSSTMFSYKEQVSVIQKIRLAEGDEDG